MVGRGRGAGRGRGLGISSDIQSVCGVIAGRGRVTPEFVRNLVEFAKRHMLFYCSRILRKFNEL